MSNYLRLAVESCPAIGRVGKYDSRKTEPL